MNKEDALNQLRDWRSLSQSLRDSTTNPVKVIELLGQMNALDACIALVSNLEEKGGDTSCESSSSE